ncbi:MATE family efflux transporter [Rhodovulum sp. BSW8]|uniref:Multidrug-efflux transporter n=1 Tax=Rhodovulum visakhapatnamense TaxID=364297 RepID=A0A4R8G1I2_9RHOB|nr:MULTISPECIES: MATE family efflux transporter [Rhodovulum]RBO54803.1 MATE family efflux transporter [Rhodovulum sp. BSW8]TDX33601.1 MATE family multidrug resistance protein [Rhodovulum visakhapatnamense]
MASVSPLPLSAHLRATLVLGLPLVGSHLAQFGISLTDAVMLGWYDVGALAAEVLATSLFFVLFIVISGFAWAVMPMIATAAAAGDETQVRRVTRMALWICLGVGLLSLPVFFVSERLFLALGQTADLSAMAQDYLAIAGPGLLPALVVMVLKSYLSALERARVVLWITLGAVAVNAVGNYLLIFGHFGLPELGLQGAALSSLIVNVLSMAAVVLYALLATPEHELFRRIWRPDWEAFWRVFRLGWPIGLTSLAEVGLFVASSVMMGWIGEVALAAHGIAVQISSAIFMVHLGLSNAATIRAGAALGRGDRTGLYRGAVAAFGVSAVAVAVSVVAFLAWPEVLVGFFLDPASPDRAAVMAVGTGLLAAAALFQLVDAAQVMALGLLRGVQDTRVPMVMAGISYWLVGMPVSYGLGFGLGWGGIGIWLGLASGLALAGVLMMTRFWSRDWVPAR